MSSGGSGLAVPDGYAGREHSYVKHCLLENYLEKLFLIVGMSAAKLGISELCYVDCFAGPWGDENEDFSATSISISLRILERCRAELEKRRVRLKLRALYVESDKAIFSRLERLLLEQAPQTIESTPLFGDFVALRSRILQWCGTRSFAFFFVDPTGWKEVAVPVLQPLLQRGQSEFLINFMYDFVNRTVSMADWKAEMSDLLGEKIEVGDLDTIQRETLLLNTYRRNLVKCMDIPGRQARSAYARILDRVKERAKYHLVYLTSHPRGVITFMEESERLDLVQKQVRAGTKVTKRAKESGMDDLFGVESYVDPQQGHATIEQVEQYWLDYLAKGEVRVGVEEFSSLLEETDWFPGDFQRALGHLIDTKRVCNLDAPRSRPKRPLHWEKGERLVFVHDKQ